MRAIISIVLFLFAIAANANGNYPVIRWFIEGDTQTYVWVNKWLAHPNPWDNTHSWLCSNAVAQNLQGVIGTGDVIQRHGAYGSDLDAVMRAEELTADYGYDILENCGLAVALPAGNHDVYGTCGGATPTVGCPPPPSTTDRYLGFMLARPSHTPSSASHSPSGLSWTQGLFANYMLLVLPYAADANEEAWAYQRIATSPAAQRFILMQHEAVEPVNGPGGGMRLLPGTASEHLANAFGVTKVPMLMGGHYIGVTDRVELGVLPTGQRMLFVNFQETDPATSLPFYGSGVWLEYQTASGQICVYDANVLTGQTNRFQPTTCWVP